MRNYYRLSGLIEEETGIEEDPIISDVTNWLDCMPNYLITHPETVSKLQSQMDKSYPGILLAGASYYGVGIPDCINNGQKIHKRLLRICIRRLLIKVFNIDKCYIY